MSSFNFKFGNIFYNYLSFSLIIKFWNKYFDNMNLKQQKLDMKSSDENVLRNSFDNLNTKMALAVKAPHNTETLK